MEITGRLFDNKYLLQKYHNEKKILFRAQQQVSSFPCQNLVSTLPTMQLNHQQFGCRCWCFMLAAADVALTLCLHAEMRRGIQYSTKKKRFRAMLRNMVELFMDICGDPVQLQ